MPRSFISHGALFALLGLIPALCHADGSDHRERPRALGTNIQVGARPYYLVSRA